MRLGWDWVWVWVMIVMAILERFSRVMIIQWITRGTLVSLLAFSIDGDWMMDTSRNCMKLATAYDFNWHEFIARCYGIEWVKLISSPRGTSRAEDVWSIEFLTVGLVGVKKEFHGFMWFHGLPFGKLIHYSLENPPMLNGTNSLFQWSCSIALVVYQRVVWIK